MKKIVLMILLTWSAISLYAQEKYTIEVTIDGLNGKRAYLQQFRENIYEIMDTAVVVNNRFEFHGNCAKVINSAMIRVEGVSGVIPLFIEPGSMKIVGNPSALYLSAIEGGRYSKALCDYSKKDLYLYDRSMSLLEEHHRTRKLNLRDSADYYSKQYQEAAKDVIKYNEEVVTINSGNPLGLYLLRAKRKSKMNYGELTTELSKYDKEVFAENYDYRMVEEHIQIVKSSEPGLLLEEIVLPDKDGKTFHSSSLKGKYVLIDFWASWCGPCRAEAKHLMDVYQYYKGENFEILGVSIDERKSDWLKAMNEDKTPWLHIHDEKNDYKRRFAIYSIPRLMLLDCDGKIISSDIRGEELTKKLKDIFKK